MKPLAGVRFNGLVYTRHALERLVEMGLAPGHVEHVLRNPDVVYTTTRYGATSRNAKRDGITVAFDGDVVITVLWNTQETYTRGGKA